MVHWHQRLLVRRDDAFEVWEEVSCWEEALNGFDFYHIRFDERRAPMRRRHWWRGGIIEKEALVSRRHEEGSWMRRRHRWGRGIYEEEAMMKKIHQWGGGINEKASMRTHQWGGINEEASIRRRHFTPGLYNDLHSTVVHWHLRLLARCDDAFEIWEEVSSWDEALNGFDFYHVRYYSIEDTSTRRHH